ncbi:MAG: alkaline phosphatase PhoX [Bacteroidota bacterium]
MKRRTFLRQSGLVSLGFLSLQAYVSSCGDPTNGSKEVAKMAAGGLHQGYGPLLPDPDRILDLPKGFSYKIISRQGSEMADGFFLPGKPDGMASFAGENGKVIVVRNHEVSHDDFENGAFGAKNELLARLGKESLYDYGSGKLPGLGGTTTFIYDPLRGEVEMEYLSLAGTIRNCAGGLTPWQSWITCEETTIKAGNELEFDHGFNFEVPVSLSPQLAAPKPIKAMGRFNHEAVCVDPRTSIVYQTEDRSDGLIYRFIPNQAEKLHAGGRLQVLAIKDKKSFDTRNWDNLDTERMEIGKEYDVEWIDINNVEAPEDDLRFRGFESGAARFARGEGMWFGDNELYFACTNGGTVTAGQIFKYVPSELEGQSAENQSPGKLSIFVEPNNTDLVEACDNITVASNGDLILCEDQATPRIVGVTPQGEIYHLAKNVGYESEFTGATFAPDGKTLFVNIQHAGLTLAITGPFGQRA